MIGSICDLTTDAPQRQRTEVKCGRSIRMVKVWWLSVCNGKVELRLTESQHDMEGLGVDDQTPIDGATSAKHPPASATASACPQQPIGVPDMELSITPTAGAPRYSVQPVWFVHPDRTKLPDRQIQY